MILQAKQRLLASKLDQAVDFMHDLIKNKDYEFPDALAKACLKFKCKADELRDAYDEKQFGIESALSEKQKAIDFNKNGEVDGDDLKKLREGKKPLAAAFLTRGLKKKFYGDLRKSLRTTGYENRLYDQVIGSNLVLVFDHPPDSQFFTSMKKLGWVKKTTKPGFTYLTMADGTWPISIGYSKQFGNFLNVKSDNGDLDERRSKK